MSGMGRIRCRASVGDGSNSAMCMEKSRAVADSAWTRSARAPTVSAAWWARIVGSFTSAMPRPCPLETQDENAEPASRITGIGLRPAAFSSGDGAVGPPGDGRGCESVVPDDAILALGSDDVDDRGSGGLRRPRDPSQPRHLRAGIRSRSPETSCRPGSNRRGSPSCRGSGESYRSRTDGSVRSRRRRGLATAEGRSSMATKASGARSGSSRNSRATARTSSALAMAARRTKSLTVVAEARLASAISSRCSREARTAIRSSFGRGPARPGAAVGHPCLLVCRNNVHTHARRSSASARQAEMWNGNAMPDTRASGTATTTILSAVIPHWCRSGALAAPAEVRSVQRPSFHGTRRTMVTLSAHPGARDEVDLDDVADAHLSQRLRNVPTRACPYRYMLECPPGHDVPG